HLEDGHANQVAMPAMAKHEVARFEDELLYAVVIDLVFIHVVQNDRDAGWVDMLDGAWFPDFESALEPGPARGEFGGSRLRQVKVRFRLDLIAAHAENFRNRWTWRQAFSSVVTGGSPVT